MSYSQLFVLADKNVMHCHPKWFDTLQHDYQAIMIEFESTEENKSLDSLSKIWNKLFENKADKDSLLLNIGGGIVCDLGGFAAATYKRGIRFIHVPTTLSAMIDAAIGGKTAINFQMIKNAVGIFQRAEQIWIFPDFLKTLPISELKNGFGELIKYALIADNKLFFELSHYQEIPFYDIPQNWINKCIEIKEKLVEEDFYDLENRRILNFGHSFGHAIESLYLYENKIISHGYAVVMGMLWESKISYLQGLLSETEYLQIKDFIEKHYSIPFLNKKKMDFIFSMILQDKKNKDNKVNLSLLKKIGKAVPNQYIDIRMLKNMVAL
jgi:3-dehydroquinate synthase